MKPIGDFSSDVMDLLIFLCHTGKRKHEEEKQCDVASSRCYLVLENVWSFPVDGF